MRHGYSLIALALLLTVVSLPGHAAEGGVPGYWKSLDEDTGEATGVWLLEERDGQLFGSLVSIRNKTEDLRCTKCVGETQEFNGKPILGTHWIHLREFGDGVWSDGYIIDTRDGSKYRAKIWRDNQGLRVRGYLGFFYRTQLWRPADATTTIDP